MLALSAATLLLQVQNLKSPEKACPHVLVTTSGERVASFDAPNHDGKPVKFRACPAGTLTMVPASQVDWPATEAAERPGASPTPTPAPAPTRASLSTLAKGRTLLEADEAVQRNQTLSGKLKVGDREMVLDRSARFFGKESVAQYLQLGTFMADTSGCPVARARAYGTVKNVSKMKLRRLRAVVVIGSLASGDYNGQVQSMDPSELVPGEEAQIYLWLSCDWALRATSEARMYRSLQEIVVVLPDVAGVPEDISRPDGTNPFETPVPSKASAPARTPTPKAR